MAALIARIENPLRTAQADVLRALIVSGCAMALIMAGNPLPL